MLSKTWLNSLNMDLCTNVFEALKSGSYCCILLPFCQGQIIVSFAGGALAETPTAQAATDFFQIFMFQLTKMYI